MTPQSTEQSGSVPGRSWYAVAVLVFLAGMALFALFLNVRMSTFGDDFVRVTVPGQAELTLDPGSYRIYHERGGMMDGTGGGVVTADDITGLRINVLKPGTGTGRSADGVRREPLHSRWPRRSVVVHLHAYRAGTLPSGRHV
jgi:hypothetical protein